MADAPTIRPCPCCDIGGLDYEPCPSRARITELERLLELAAGWLQDPSAFWGTSEGTKFIQDLDAALPAPPTLSPSEGRDG